MKILTVARNTFAGILTALIFAAVVAQPALACKVLVVMRNEENFPWDLEVKEGVNDIIGKTCDVTYF